MELAESQGVRRGQREPGRPAQRSETEGPVVDLGIEGFIGHGLMQSIKIGSLLAEDHEAQRAALLRSLERMLRAPEGSHEATSALADVQAIHSVCKTDDVCSLAEDLISIVSTPFTSTAGAVPVDRRKDQDNLPWARLAAPIQILFSVLVLATAIASSVLLQETTAMARSPMTAQQITSAALYMRL